MPKTQKRLTKRERKELFGKGPSGTPNAESSHIHCIACGRHIDPTELSARPATAARLTCKHGSRFAACTGCVTEAQSRLDEHDRTGLAPRITSAWH
jgi:RNA polymerase-binding transcription factor DksA